MTSADRPVMRLNRFLARAGCGSRRSVEELIRAGRVRIDGETVIDPARSIAPDRQLVTLDETPVTLPERWRVLAFHKPHGVISSLRPQGDRPCLLEYRRLAGLPKGLVPIGRLDAGTTGLLLWTDDGLLQQELSKPRSHVWKVYHATLDGPLDHRAVALLRNGGVELDGRPCLPARLRHGPDPLWWEIALREGRKRQIRRMFEAVGRRVVQLHRVAYGPIRLGRLAPGRFRELTAAEITALRKAVRRQGST